MSLFRVAIAALALFGVPQAAAARAELLVRNVNVVRIDRDARATPTDILIAGDRIVRVGRNLKVRRGARIIDGGGRYAIPGLWDMHAHLAATNAVGRKPEEYVGHGVLGLRDMGGRLADLKALRSEIANGRVGPTVIVAGPTLNGIQAAPFHRPIPDAETARRAVRELKNEGVDFIKVHRATNRDAFLAAIDEARRLGLKVSGHVPLVLKWSEAADVGMHTIEHAQTIIENEVSDPRSREQIRAAVVRLEGPYGQQLFAKLAKRNVYFDPTLAFYAESAKNVDEKLGAERRLLLSRLEKLVLLAHRQGVPLLVGTDATDGPAKFVAAEIEMLVSAGVRPRAALQAATVNAAAAAGRPDLGRIAAGGQASFVLLDDDPTTSVTTLRKPYAVVLRGSWLDSLRLHELRQSAQPGR